MYCDEVQLEADTVLATLYVAKKYIVPHLARACVNYLETSLTAKNACLLLSQSRLFEEPDLMQRCWEVIDAQVSFNLKPLLLTINSKNNQKLISPNNLLSLDYTFPFSSHIKTKTIDKSTIFNLNPMNSAFIDKSCFLFDIKWNNNNCQKYSDRNKIQFLDEVQNIFFRDNYAVLYKNIENNDFEGICDNDVLEC